MKATAERYNGYNEQVNNMDHASGSLIEIIDIEGQVVHRTQLSIPGLNIAGKLDHSPLPLMFCAQDLKPIKLSSASEYRNCATPELFFAGRETIILGRVFDPFGTDRSALPFALRFLEQIVRQHAGRILIQTRSPYVLLAAPLLKQLPGLTVVVAVETLSPDLSKLHFPRVAFPAERIRAAEALRSQGIDVQIQVSPIVHSTHFRAEVQELAETVSEVSKVASVVPIADLVSHLALPRNLQLQQALKIARANQIDRELRRQLDALNIPVGLAA